MIDSSEQQEKWVKLFNIKRWGTVVGVASYDSEVDKFVIDFMALVPQTCGSTATVSISYSDASARGWELALKDLNGATDEDVDTMFNSGAIGTLPESFTKGDSDAIDDAMEKEG